MKYGSQNGLGARRSTRLNNFTGGASMEELNMEVWDLYSEEREVIGEHIRGTELPEDGFHLVVHVWIRNSAGKYLMAQRSANKPTFPLMWECVGGSVLKGETSIHSAMREVQEEVGLNLRPEDGRLLSTKIRRTIDGKRYNDIVDVWLFQYDGEVPLENATTDEVEQIRWMDRAEIEVLRQENRLVYSIKDLSYFFDKMEP